MILVASNAEDGPGFLLSGFASTPFTLAGVSYASMDSFAQSIKFQDPSDQRRIAAKKSRRALYEGNRLSKSNYVYYDGKGLPKRGVEHLALLEQAFRAKIDQNEAVREALLSTGNEEFVVKVGVDDLPADRFTLLLGRVRAELRRSIPLS